MDATNKMLPTSETHDPDFIKFESLANGITIYAYKLLMQPDTILKITDAKSDYQIPLNMIFFQDCPFFKKTTKTSEKVEIIQNSKPVEKSFTVHKITFNSCFNQITAATVQKYLNHYFLKLHSPSFKLEPTFEDCGELLALAQLIEDKEVWSTSYDFFKNNIKLENVGQAISIGLYDSVAKFIASSVETTQWREIEYILERLSKHVFMNILYSMENEYFMADGYISNKLGKSLMKLFLQIVKRDRSEIYVRKENNLVDQICSYRMFDTVPVEFDFSKRVVTGSKSSKSSSESSKSSKTEEKNHNNLVDMLLECATLCKINIAMTRTIILQELNGILKPEELGYACSILFGQQELKWNLNLKFFHDLEDSKILRQKTVDEVMNMWNLNAIEDLDQPGRPNAAGAVPGGGIFNQYLMPDFLGDLHPAGFGLEPAGIVRAGAANAAQNDGQVADGLMRRVERRANAVTMRNSEREDEVNRNGPTDENFENVRNTLINRQNDETLGVSSRENPFSIQNLAGLSTEATNLQNALFGGAIPPRQPTADQALLNRLRVDNVAGNLATSTRMLEQSMRRLEQNLGNINGRRRSGAEVARQMATRSGRLSLPSRRSSSQPPAPSGGKKPKLDKNAKKEQASNTTITSTSGLTTSESINTPSDPMANARVREILTSQLTLSGRLSQSSSINPLRSSPASTNLLNPPAARSRPTPPTANVHAAMNQLRRQEDQARRRRDELRRRARRDNGVYRGHNYQAHPAQQAQLNQYMSLRRSVRAEIVGRGCDDDKSVSFYYEIKILYLETDQKIFGIGLGSANFDTNADVMVGWRENSYGYHSDDGGFFENEGHASQQRGEIYDKGDVIGCGYSKEYNVIYFTKNGIHLHSIRNFADIKYYPIMTFKVDHTQRATEVLLCDQNEWVFKNQRFLDLEADRTGAGDGLVSAGVGSQPVDESGHQNGIFGESLFGEPPMSPRTDPLFALAAYPI